MNTTEEKVPAPASLDKPPANRGELKLYARGTGYIKRKDGTIVPFELKGEFNGNDTHTD